MMLAAAKQKVSHVYQKAAASPWGKALTAYYGEKSGAGKIWALASLGEPLWADMYRIAKTPEFKAKAFKGIRFREDPKSGQRAPFAADVPRYLKQWQRAMREELERNPRRGEQLRAKEGTFKKLATDLAWSPMMWIRPVPARAAMEYAAPRVVRRVGVPIVRAIGRRPKMARWLLSPAKRVEQLGDMELMHLYRQLRGRLGQVGRVRDVSAARVKEALGTYSGREIEEAALLAQRYESRGAYSAAVRTGRGKAASSNRVLEAAEKIRKLTRRAFGAIPRRTAMPGTAEEGRAIARIAGTRKVQGKGGLGAAEAWARTLVWVDRWRGRQRGTTQQSFEWIIARDYPRGVAEYVSDRIGTMPVDLQRFWGARVRAAGGAWDAKLVRGVWRDALEEVQKRPARFAAAARKVRLKPGEFRLREELVTVRKSGKLVAWKDQATGEFVTPYRKAYYPLPRAVRAGVPARRGISGKAAVPGGRRPRTKVQPVVARMEREVYDDLRRMTAAEVRYGVLRGHEAELARAIARSSALRDPARRRAALDVFSDLKRKFGPKAPGVFRRGLELLDHWGVTTPKKLYTLYNPAWYFKNYLDTVVVKNLLAGISPRKLHRFVKQMPRDVYGREVDVGVTWTKELTGMEVSSSPFARVGNAIENTGRRALWDDVYQRELRVLTKAGRTTEAAHVGANEAAMKMVAKVHFDYGDLSRLDEVMRRIIPFWIYERNQLRWMAEQAVMRPRLMYGGYKFFDVGEKGEGPGFRMVPGVPTLAVAPLGVLSPQRYFKTLSGVLTRDPKEQKRWREAGWLGKLFRVGEKGGFYPHVVLEQGLSALLKRKDLMEDKSWKEFAPLVGALGKMTGRSITFLGVWRTLCPKKDQPREGEVERYLKRRVMARRAFSILDGEEWSLARCEKYVRREMQAAGVSAFFGLYPRVREPKYDEMQRLLKKRSGLSYVGRGEFDQAHPEVVLFLASLQMKAR